eukprot:TRINITY_DN8586_c0_g1_i2.p1 TRINITY_DN8586_c0_g1~~TRINITY_DN8586_c0_g1_i2.p1  ORF type:complete len:1127 (+),score=310.92 TRINITY_DN8586_c0_g1_i2:105-3485(+)
MASAAGGGINVIIPVPGTAEGAALPAALTRVCGREVLWWVLDSLRLPEGAGDSVVLASDPSLESHLQSVLAGGGRWGASSLVVPLAASMAWCELDAVRQALDALPEEIRERPTLVGRCDAFGDGAATAWRPAASAAPVTAVLLPPGADAEQPPRPLGRARLATDGAVAEVAQPGDTQALPPARDGPGWAQCTGWWGFASGTALRAACGDLLCSSPGALLCCATAAADLVRRGQRCRAVQVASRSWHELGSAQHSERFACSERAREAGALRIVCELDGLLPADASEPSRAASRTIQWLRGARAAGHKIIIHTSRGMREAGGNPGAALAEAGEQALRGLRQLGLQYDELSFARPHGDLYLAPRQVDSLGDVAAQTGLAFDPVASDEPQSSPPRTRSGDTEVAGLRLTLQQREAELAELRKELSLARHVSPRPSGTVAAVPPTELILPPAKRVPLNVIIPMGGLGRAFDDAGYRCPKPMVNIVGKPMLFWLTDLLCPTISAEDTVWIVLSEQFENQFSISDRLRRRHPTLTIRAVLLSFETAGWAESVLAVTQSMSGAQRLRRTVSIDCHTLFLSYDVLSAVRDLPDGQGASFCFEVGQGSAAAGRFSFVSTEGDGKISDIREKVQISSLANCGAYAFPSGARLYALLREEIDEPVQTNRPGTPRSDQFAFTYDYHPSAVITRMMLKGVFFRARQVPGDSFVTLGTPGELQEFVSRIAMGAVTLAVPVTRFCFDQSGVGVEPNGENIELARQLKRAGHVIIVSTTTDHSRGHTVVQMLRDMDIPHDEVYFAKPRADVYVDNLAINAWTGIEKDLGWHLGSKAATLGGVAARHFNDVHAISATQVIKSSKSDILRGEIHYYRHLPAGLEHLFPQVYEVCEPTSGDGAYSIVLERVHGVTFTQLVTNNCLTSKRLRVLLEALHRLHTHPGDEQGKLDGSARPEPLPGNILCRNYAPKVRQRFEQNLALYRSFRDVDTDRLAAKLLTFLEDFESSQRAVHAWYIHGDPVFSNVLFSERRQVKLIDMRGELAGTLSTQGDAHYDLAKVFQSLCGYDFILVGKDVTESTAQMLDELRESFWAFVSQHYPTVRARDVRLITAQLFFSMLCLHENRAHQASFLRAAQSLLTVEGLL